MGSKLTRRPEGVDGRVWSGEGSGALRLSGEETDRSDVCFRAGGRGSWL